MRDYMGTFQTASAAFSQHFHRFHSIDKREAGASADVVNRLAAIMQTNCNAEMNDYQERDVKP